MWHVEYTQHVVTVVQRHPLQGQDKQIVLVCSEKVSVSAPVLYLSQSCYLQQARGGLHLYTGRDWAKQHTTIAAFVARYHRMNA